MPATEVFISYSRSDSFGGGGVAGALDHGRHLDLPRPLRPPRRPALAAGAGAGDRPLRLHGGPARPRRYRRLAAARDPARPRPPEPAEKTPTLPGHPRPAARPARPTTSRSARFLGLNTWIDLRRGLDEPEALQRLIAAVQGQRDRRPRPRPAARRALPLSRPPAVPRAGRRPVLRPPALRRRARPKVRQRSATNLVAVLGRSGSGKSSIVFAGLFPALRKEKRPRPAGGLAHRRLCAPGSEPLHALIDTFDPPEDELGRTQKLAQINDGVELLRSKKVSLAQLVARSAQGRRRNRHHPPAALRRSMGRALHPGAAPRGQDRRGQAPRRRRAPVRRPRAGRRRQLALHPRPQRPLRLLSRHPGARRAARCRPGMPGQSRADDRGGAARRYRGSRPRPSAGRRGRADQDASCVTSASTLASGRQDEYDIGKLPLLEYALEQAWAKRDNGRIGLGQYAGLERALEDRANQVYDRNSRKSRRPPPSVCSSASSRRARAARTRAPGSPCRPTARRRRWCRNSPAPGAPSRHR